MEFITWCNGNTGFLSALLSLCSILISVIAIIIAIVTARLPYKKKLRVAVGSYIGTNNESEGIYVQVINVGNIPVKISDVGIMHGKKKCINIDTFEDSRVMLQPMETTQQYLERKDLNSVLNHLNNARIYAFATDTEGRVYKKYICKSNQLKI